VWEIRNTNISCSLSASATSVPSGGSVTFSISVTNAPSGTIGYWYGTKNGAVDSNYVYFGAVPRSYTYGNTQGTEGIYTRRAEIRNAQGIPICMTNSVTVEMKPTPTCRLSVSSTDVPAGGYYAYSVSGNYLPPGTIGYWYGTKNGVTDHTSVLAGAVPATFSYTNQPGWQGVYARWMEIRDGNNRVVCVTNTVTTELAPAPTTCALETSASVVAAGQPYWYKVTGSNLPPGTIGYWYGTKNGVTDHTSVLAGAVPATFPYTNQPGWQGVYARWMEIRDGNNRVVCVTNTVTTELK
jgi:hypothetical protein